jgi:hypothetical protein
MTESVSADQQPNLCKCVGKHIPKPMAFYTYNLNRESGGPYVWLCPTSLDNVEKLWDLYERTGGRPEWEILKNYSEYARYLVEQGRELRRKANAVSPTPIVADQQGERIGF